ncbi:MAG: helix-turn-helix domain-containing protein [Gammaproteobacteria bacterium]|nr:helix-turn-helix domain-containing protein [Gammaproteobacteria bacterium]
MDKSKVLWLDLRIVQDQVSYSHYLNGEWVVSRFENTEKLDLHIRKTDPVLLCFEYDYPCISSLSALRHARRMFPMLPTIMLTEQHSETLAIWALRTRVWDYFVKPLQPHKLVASAATVLRKSTPPKEEVAHNCLLSNPLPSEFRFRFIQNKKTFSVQTFVENHYHEKIYEKDAAKLCDMEISTFSRIFKKEHEITFRDYLIDYRIGKALELLQNPKASVTDIAYTVGFNDPSYFTRIFKRIIGVSPSQYRIMV